MDIPVICFYAFNILTLISMSVPTTSSRSASSGASAMMFIYFVWTATSANFIYHDNKLGFVICEIIWALMMFLFEFVILERIRSNIEQLSKASGKTIKKEDLDQAGSNLLLHSLIRMFIAILVSNFSF
jgi:glycerol-3-phosphate acyltransferase PlsY